MAGRGSAGEKAPDARFIPRTRGTAWTPERDAELLTLAGQMSGNHGAIGARIGRTAIAVQARLGRLAEIGLLPVSVPVLAAEPAPAPPAPRIEAAPVVLDAWAREARRQSRRHMSDAEAAMEGAAMRRRFEARKLAGGGTTPRRPGTPHQVNTALHAPHVHGDAP